MVKPVESKITESTATKLIDIPEEELNWSTVSLSEVVQRNKRLEASVFDIEGKHAREILKKCKYKLLPLYSQDNKGLFQFAHDAFRFSRKYVSKKYGISFLGGSDILNINSKRSCKYLSLKTKGLDILRVKPKTLLITSYGTLGNVMLTTDYWGDCTVSENMIQILCSPDRENDIGYIYAFLKTKMGKLLITTNETGSTVSYMKPSDLKYVLVPNPPALIKTNIHKLIMDSFKLRDVSNELIDKAEKLLISELDLPPIEKIKPKYFEEKLDFRNYSVKLSQIDNRIDSSYHVPIVDAILKYLKRNAEEVTILGDNRISEKIILPGRFKRIYVEEGQGVVFFGGKQIYELDPSNKKYLSLTHHSKRIKEELILEENTILITCSGTIGKVNIVPKHWDGWTANQHIIRVIPANNSIAGYIYCWLSTDYGYELIKRFTYGSVVDEINDNHVSQVQIPLLKNKQTQRQINDLVLETNQKRYDAYLLEQKAIKMVSDLVIHTEKHRFASFKESARYKQGTFKV